MGSNVDGQVFAEPNGTGSVKGWDALVARVTNAETSLTNKVDKVTGKGLSTNDFTDALKTKLDGIEAGAEVNDPLYSTTGSNTNGAMTQAATTNAIAQKLSHGNLTTGIGLEKTVTGSGTNTAIKVEVDDTVVMYTDIAVPSSTAFVNTANIIDGAVTTPKLAADSVTTAKIATGAVTTDEIGNAAVTSDKIDWTTMPFSDIEFGIDNTTSGASSITFSRSHSTAPDAILCTMISVNNDNISIDATVHNVTATGFRVKKSWMNNATSGPAAEPYYWLALWH